LGAEATLEAQPEELGDKKSTGQGDDKESLKDMLWRKICAHASAGGRCLLNNMQLGKTKAPIKLLDALDDLEESDTIETVGVYKCPVGKVERDLYIIVLEFRGRLVRCLLDTGSNVTVIDKGFADKQGWCIAKHPIELCYASQKARAVASGYLKKDGNLVGGREDIRVRPVVMPLQSNDYDMIVGNRELMRMGICLRGLPSPTQRRSQEEKQDEELLTNMTGADTKQIFELTQKLQDMLESNSLIPFHDRCDLPGAIVHLNLTDEKVSRITTSKRNMVARQYEEAVTDAVQEWLKEGTTQRLIGKTPVNLSLLAVKQLNPNGETKKIRVCLDLRPLNALLSMDNTVLPTIDELLHTVAGHKYYSTLDLKSGYHQLPVATRDRRFLAFTWKGVTYQFNSAPFGINFLPAQFHKLIAGMFSDLKGVVVYLDDICVFTDSEKEHNDTLLIVLERLERARLNLNLKKCLFARSCIRFLGYQVSMKGIEVDTERRERLLQTPKPSTGRKLKCFLATVSFLRRHLPYFGDIAAPLYDFQTVQGLITEAPGWKEKGEPALEACMRLLRSPAILKSPLPGLELHLETDASETGYGGSLFQLDPITKQKRYVEFFSGSFKGASRAHSIPRKEMAALMKGLHHCRYYLLGATFQVWTDNMALTHLHTMAPTSAVLERWFSTISQFDFVINHVPGSQNTLPDVFSRWYDAADTQEDKEDGLDGLEPDLMVNTITDEIDDGDSSDWQLVNEFVMEAANRWGSFTVDAFASRQNKQCSSYIDKTVDFFTVEGLGHERIWANPPFRMITRFLERIKTKGWSAVVVVPYWPDALWFPLWRSMLTDAPIVINQTLKVFRKFGTQLCAHTPWTHTIIARVGSGPAFELPEKWLSEFEYRSQVVGRLNLPRVATMNCRRSSRIQGKQQRAAAQTNSGLDEWDQVAEGFADVIDGPDDINRGTDVTITADMKLEIAEEYHRYTHANERDLTRMLKDIGGYDWQDVSQVVQQVDQRCSDCELNKPDRTGFHPLKSALSDFPGDIWTVDLLFFDKHQTAGATTCLLHVIDNFSSFSILRVLPNKEALTVATALNSIMYEHGQPRTLFYDGGGEFRSLFREVFLNTREIAGIQGLPYRPQSQGQNERKHHKIKQLIRMALHKFAHDWAEVVPMVMGQVNDTWSIRHKSTPFAIYYGRASHALTSAAPLSRLAWHERLALFQAAVQPRLRVQLEQYAASLKRAFDKRHARDLGEFKVGDWVKIRNVGTTSANTLFKGPYVILARVSGGYNVALTGTSVQVNVAPVPPEQLSLWKRLGVDVRATTASGGTALTEEVYDWHSILAHEFRFGSTWYQVKWMNGEITWEPADIFGVDTRPINNYYARMHARGAVHL
jgi:transposase InsO family protein